jgi:hypothetical protein
MKNALKNITKQGEGETMRNLYNPEISQSAVDDLFNGTLIPRKTRPVAVEGTGILKRGLPLTSEDGITFTAFVPGQGPGTVEDIEDVLTLTLNNGIIGILLFDVDADDEEEARNAVLGISGEFNRNKIEGVLGEKLDPADVMQAWGKNIHIEADKTYPATPDFPLG